MKHIRIKIALLFIMIIFSAFSMGCGSSGSAGSSSGGGDGDVIDTHSTISPAGSIILATTKSTGAVADGQESYTVVAQVLDSDGYALSDQEVKFSSSGNKGLVAINPVQGITEADGTITCTVADICSTDDTLTINASCGDVISVGSIGLAFVGKNESYPNIGSVRLAAPVTTGKVADGEDSYTIIVQVLDHSGSPMSDQDVTFTANGNTGLVAINPPVTTTQADGTATCRVRNICQSDDTVNISASCGNVDSIGSIGLAFTGSESGGVQDVDSVRLAAPITTGKVANGEDSYTVTVQVSDRFGLPLGDQAVVFSANGNTGLVAINPPVTTTQADGTATCNISDISQDDDSVTISASCGGVASIGAIGLAFNGSTNSGSSNVGSIRLAAAITTGKVANGEDSYTVTVQVLDKDGHPMSDQDVTFSARGYAGLVAINPPVTTTMADGTATCSVTDIYPTDDSVIIKASCGGISSVNSINLVFAESISDNPETASIVLTANPMSLTADGSSSSAITAILTDNSGKPVLKGTSVTFKTTLGTFPNGGTTWTTSTSNDSGTLTVSLIAALTPGTASISCEANNVSQLINIELTGDGLTVSAIDLRPSSTTVSADGFSQIQIVASVKTADNQAVSGAQVTFKSTRGTITSPYETDINGQATARLTSDRCNDNSVIVTAECQGVTKDTTIVFTGVNVDLEADRNNLLAGENNFSTITATLKDAAGNPISNADILISSNMGEIDLLDSLLPITDINGKVKFCLYSIDPGNVTVNVSGNGAKNNIDINFTQYLFTLETSLNPIRVNESTGVIAKIENAGTGSVEGETVRFSSSMGAINPLEKQIEGGEAWTTLTANNQAGVATIDANITINSDSPPTVLSASTQVNIIGWDADKIVLTADPNIIAVGTGESTITAKLFDANDQPVGDTPVYFRVASGPGGGEYLSDSVMTTNSAGIATTKLNAGTLSSILRGVKVEASISPAFPDNPIAPTAAFLTIAGPVSKIGVGINLHTVEPEGGHLNVDVSALVTDSNGNPVADGSLVNFSVDAIGFDEDRDNDGILHIWDSDGNRFGNDSDLFTYYEDYIYIKSSSGNEKTYYFKDLGVDWYTDDVNLDGQLTKGQDFTESEDRNGNGLLDTGEDINGNGIIDPVNSCVIGKSIPTINGVAATTLTYLQPHAANIKVRITAESGGVSNFYENILLCTQKMVDNGTCGLAY